MASVTEGVSASRATGRGIVLAGDRGPGRLAAARHTQRVRILKFALPALALFVIGSFSLSVFDKTGWGEGLAQLDVPQIISENLAMENPHYEGFNSDGGRYWVTAQKAMQDLKNLSLIKLEAISGELIAANKERTKLTATRGTFDNKQSVIELFDAIDIAGDNGLKAQLTRATIKTKEGIILSDAPVRVEMPAGTITSSQLMIRQKEKEYIFKNQVRTDLKARAPKEPTAATESADDKPIGAFANSNEPILITANRLDIDDVGKLATYTGTVRAVQGQSILTSPEMVISYEGSAAEMSGASDAKDSKDKAAKKDGETNKKEGGTKKSDAAEKDKSGKDAQQADAADKAADTGGKVKRVIAKNPVTLTQANGQQATSRSAEFDTTTQMAVLEGDVVLSQGADRKVMGDRAEIDQLAGTVVLTGPVSLTQGKNELHGRKLVFNRNSGKMNLTGASPGNGRISARFSQTGGPPPVAHKDDEPKRGVAFGGNFKTDPNAPVDVAADRLDVDDHAKQAVFSGDVKAQQAGFVLEAAELTANYTGSAGLAGADEAANTQQTQQAAHLTRIRAKKNVVVTSLEGQKATGDWADYDTKANMVTLGGDVVMTQGKNIVRGTKLVIDMTSGESVISTEAAKTGMTSSSQADGSGVIVKSGRPSAVFYPNQLKKSPGKGAASVSDGWQARSSPSQ